MSRDPIAPTGTESARLVPGEVDARARARYREYRRRQATGLLSLLPEDAVRPLYRHALAWAQALGKGDPRDPLGLLVTFCEEMLPLPPFEVWMADRAAYPAAHLDEAGAGPAGADAPAGDPVTVAVRDLEAHGERWNAELDVRPDGEVWRGHITFRTSDGSKAHSTGEIFREGEAFAVRERFLEFDDHTLQAFLRSATP